MNVELHIETLLLHGGNPADRARIAAAVQRELTRLLAQHGPPTAPPGSLSERLGAAVGQAVYRELLRAAPPVAGPPR